VTLVICPTPVGRRHSHCMLNFGHKTCLRYETHGSGHMPDYSQKTRHRSYARLRSYAQLRSYARLWSEDTTPVVCPTSIERWDSDRTLDSSRKAQFRPYARLWLENATPIICPTPVGRCDSGHVPIFGEKMRLWSEDVTSVVCSTLVGRRGSDHMLDYAWKT
jgi:hypothetical protein